MTKTQGQVQTGLSDNLNLSFVSVDTGHPEPREFWDRVVPERTQTPWLLVRGVWASRYTVAPCC